MVDINFTAIYWHKICKKKCYYNIKLHRFIWKKPYWWSFSFPRKFLLASAIPDSQF